MKEKYGHVMLDLETMSTEVNASIVSIGAVEFDIESGKIGKTFYTPINLQDCIDNKLDINANTIIWWLQKSDVERLTITEPTTITLKQGLLNFDKFLVSCGEDVKLWGNGSSFDCAILRNAYTVIGYKQPWSFRNERDLRTMSALNPEIKKNEPFDGVKHHPIDDCFHQIKYLVKIFKSLKL